MYVCVYMCVYVYIYIYIYSEREGYGLKIEVCVGI